MRAPLVASYLALSLCAAHAAHAQPAPAQAFTVLEVRVHGNHTTPETEILGLAAIPIGTPVSEADLGQATTRLRASSHFDDVELRVRSRSIDDPSQVAILIVVRERPGVTPDLRIDRSPPVLRRLRSSTMFLPILDYEDGYGLSYGARVSFVDPLGSRSRLSLPASWGGTRRVAAELEKAFETGPGVTSLSSSASLSQREHPYYGMDDRRLDVQGTLRTRVKAATVAAMAGWSDVEFGVLDERHTTVGLEAGIDTRTDPTFPRNAVFARGRVRWLTFGDEAAFVDPTDRRLRRTDVVAQGFVGFVGTSVIAVSGRYETTDAALPPYLRSMLGGTGTVRGFETGFEVGDRLWAASIELRVPLSTATKVGRVGLRAFTDTGAIAAWRDALADAPRRTGMGIGGFTQASLLQVGVDVAYGLDQGWRLHVSSGVRF